MVLLNRSLLALLAVLALTPLSAHASVVKAETLAEMTDQVPVIVRGKVIATQTVRDDAAGKVWTLNEIEVTERLKGNAPARLLVRQSGGVWRGRATSVAGAPSFAEGQDTILFLEHAPDDASLFITRGLSAGKFDVETSRTQQLRVMRHTQGLVFATPGKPKPGEIQRVGGDEDFGTPEMFLEQVKTWVRAGSQR